MAPEGWNGRSVRQHFEDISSEVARINEELELLRESLESLLAKLGKLQEDFVLLSGSPSSVPGYPDV